MSEASGGVTTPSRQGSQRDRLLRTRSHLYALYYIFVWAATVNVAGPLVAFVVARHLQAPRSAVVEAVLVAAAIGAVSWLLLIVVAVMFRERIRSTESDIQELEFQMELQDVEAARAERRAEQILHINDFQLRRYYDMSLSQSSWVLLLGAFCILLGVGMIGATAWLVGMMPPEEPRSLVAALGAVGSVLTNFVGAIYLKLNASATQTLTMFHSRLVSTHQSLLASLLASRIEDDTLRWQTLTKLATNLSGVAAEDDDRLATTK